MLVCCSRYCVCVSVDPKQGHIRGRESSASGVYGFLSPSLLLFLSPSLLTLSFSSFVSPSLPPSLLLPQPQGTPGLSTLATALDYPSSRTSSPLLRNTVTMRAIMAVIGLNVSTLFLVPPSLPSRCEWVCRVFRVLSSQFGVCALFLRVFVCVNRGLPSSIACAGLNCVRLHLCVSACVCVCIQGSRARAASEERSGLARAKPSPPFDEDSVDLVSGTCVCALFVCLFVPRRARKVVLTAHSCIPAVCMRVSNTCPAVCSAIQST